MSAYWNNPIGPMLGGQGGATAGSLNLLNKSPIAMALAGNNQAGTPYSNVYNNNLANLLSQWGNQYGPNANGMSGVGQQVSNQLPAPAPASNQPAAPNNSITYDQYQKLLNGNAQVFTGGNSGYEPQLMGAGLGMTGYRGQMTQLTPELKDQFSGIDWGSPVPVVDASGNVIMKNGTDYINQAFQKAMGSAKAWQSQRDQYNENFSPRG